MQKKIDQLIDIFNSLRSERQKNYAIKLLSELVDVINNQSKTIKELTERKMDIVPGNFDTELDKYILVLIIYGFCQNDFKLINYDTINFIAKNRAQLTRKPLAIDMIRIQNMIMSFEFDNEKQPMDLMELKKYIDGFKDQHTEVNQGA